MLTNISILGSGSWATALVKIFAESGVNVVWLVRSEEQAACIRENGCNPRYLSNAALDLNYIRPVVHIQEALQNAQLVIFALPSAHLVEMAGRIRPEWLQGRQLAVSIKSFVPGTGFIPGVFLGRYFNVPGSVIFLGGPCHAEEVALNRNTYLTVAGRDREQVEKICNRICVPYVRAVPNDDPLGVEYAGILKNIIGIGTGIASGLYYGENFLAALASNAMRELHSFLHAVHAVERDLFDSAYFGDMLVTAYSGYSRNRTLGKLIGRGMRVTKALQSMQMVAEGYHASRELAAITQQMNISLPIMNSINRILHQHGNPFHEFRLVEQQLR